MNYIAIIEMSPNICKRLLMLISEEYSGIYVKEQLVYLLFLVVISNAIYCNNF